MDGDRRPNDPVPETDEIVYKTKVIHFLGRETPIVLQNDNGPCPLIAICNVLLLRNSLKLSLDVSEVSQQKLLALVAEKLIDANSNVQDKDDGYVNNQQQNISDAIDLLPRLATGIDVNVHFRRINDFEFTRECAIFDLFDISLVHGWIVDPQDIDTAAAIGSKTYNTLVAELVAYQARNSDREERSVQEDDYVDFAAATTATLGVPSPSLSRGRSFDDCPAPVSDEQRKGKGDLLEEEELLRALNVSRDETLEAVSGSMSSVADTGSNTETEITNDAFSPEISGTSNEPLPSDAITGDAFNSSNDCKGSDSAIHAPGPHNSVSESNVTPIIEDSEACERFTNAFVSDKPQDIEVHEQFTNRVGSYEDLVIASAEHESPIQTSTENPPSSHVMENQGSPIDLNLTFQSGPGASSSNVNFSNGEPGNVPEVVNVEGSEPIYEGEERIDESASSTYDNREPVYEGEVVLAEQAEKMEHGSYHAYIKDEDTPRQWLLVKNFLEHNASQLTIYGLFCLQDGLKERELCVFFRNNHFSTMFKFNGELYLLATDQGYINQPDLVWEKLNEVNGDTIFMTGNFMEFKVDNQGSQSWNEQSAMSNTADYLARLENSAPGSDLSSDLQLAIALQQQEFEQQPQRQQQHPQQQHSQQHPQQSPVPGRSRLVTGPQVSRNSYSSQKSESKAKDKCNVM